MSEYNYTGKQLAELFADELRLQEFDIRSVGELVHFTYQGEDYYAFLRSISYAGNPHPKNRYRAQMPKRPYLEAYRENGGIFLFIGYDKIRDVYVIWNPFGIRPRINQKDIVSLFCEEEALNKAKDEGFFWTKLPNGGLYVTLEIEKLSDVLGNLKYFQDDAHVSSRQETSTDVSSFIVSLIKKGSSTLEIIEECMDKFANEFPDRDYLTWRTIIKSQKEVLEKETDEDNTIESVEEIAKDNIPEEHDIAYYEKHISEMVNRTTDNKAKVCKLLLLLSTFEYIPKCPSTRDIKNKIPLLAAWEGIFLKNVNKYVGKLGRESTLFSSPFFLLEEEPYWRLIPIEDDYQKTGYNIKTFINLQDIYSGVEVDEELVALIRNTSSREELSNYVIDLLPSLKSRAVSVPKNESVPLTKQETPQETPQVSVRQQEQPTEHLETQSGWDKLKALFNRK